MHQLGRDFASGERGCSCQGLFEILNQHVLRTFANGGESARQLSHIGAADVGYASDIRPRSDESYGWAWGGRTSDRIAQASVVHGADCHRGVDRNRPHRIARRPPMEWTGRAPAPPMMETVLTGRPVLHDREGPGRL
jgi:hypothetical protein